MTETVTITTPEGETVTLPVADVPAWIRDREWANNYGAAEAGRNALEAARLRAEAAAHAEAAEESFQRCDTDGFLSQWASGLNAQLKRRQADIVEAGGKLTFTRWLLTDLDGKPVEDAKLVDTRFGLRWRIDRTDEWMPFRPVRESTLGRRGYAERLAEPVTAPAKAVLSGQHTVHVRTVRADIPLWKHDKEGWHLA